jgi:lysine-N-methylase
VHVEPEERDRLLALPWVRERLRVAGTDFVVVLNKLCLPVVEKDRLPQCVFLDPDGLCAIHKREGVEATPLTCRIFPFGFVREPDGLRTFLSHLCPSIRDNYGDLLAPHLEAKRALVPQPVEVPQHMRLGSHLLEARIFLDWADRAAAIIQSSTSAAAGLAQCAAWTDELATLAPDDDALPPHGLDHPVPPVAAPALAVPQSWPTSIKLLLGLLLVPLAHPMRLHRLHRGPRRLPLYAGAARFMRGMTRLVGTVDLMFMPAPASLALAADIPAPAPGSQPALLIRDYAAGLLRRRNVLLGNQSLEQSLFRLILAAALVSWFARIRAAARQAMTPDELDVREGISACEFVLTYHGCMLDSHPLGRALLQFLAQYPPTRERLLQAI